MHAGIWICSKLNGAQDGSRPFDEYIFCVKNKRKHKVLRDRTLKLQLYMQQSFITTHCTFITFYGYYLPPFAVLQEHMKSSYYAVNG